MLEIFRRSHISTIYVQELTLMVRRLIRPTGLRNCEKIVPLNTAATSPTTGVLFKKHLLYMFLFAWLKSIVILLLRVCM